MALSVYNVDVIQSSTILQLAGGDEVLVDKDVLLASTGGTAFDGSDPLNAFYVYGTIAGDFGGIELGDDLALDFGYSIQIFDEGSVVGDIATAMYGAGSVLRNDGEIAASYTGVISGGSGSTSSLIKNSGEISSRITAIERGFGSTETLVIKNTGLISGAQSSFSDGSANAVERIVNKGVMEGAIQLGAGNDVYKGAKGELDGFVKGGSGNDLIATGLDDDSIYGDAGNDTLSGGAGLDVFFFNTTLNASNNVDTILDFNVTSDRIRLEDAVFTRIVGSGTLSSGQFAANTTGTATQADDRIIYETDTGRLFYDSNGSASGGSTLFAVLKPGLALSAQDFFVG